MNYKIYMLKIKTFLKKLKGLNKWKDMQCCVMNT